MASVLGNGGARGVLQIGAIRAPFEAGYQPNLMMGTSIEAVHATYLVRVLFMGRGYIISGSLIFLWLRVFGWFRLALLSAIHTPLSL